MNKIKQKLVQWLFKEQLAQLKATQGKCDTALMAAAQSMNKCFDLERSLMNTVGSIEVAVDVHQRSNSWAVICIQGHKSDFIKFVDLDARDIEGISGYLRRFNRNNIKADFPHGLTKQEFFRL